MGSFIDITGQRFGRWVVLQSVGRKDGEALWLCKCDCGTVKSIKGSPLRQGKTTSCGCYRKENPASKTHGMSNTRLYHTWKGIRSRCYSKNNSRTYNDYGGRGIKMCKEWYDSFESFRKWALENGYNDRLTIERIDVNGNYEPNNCTFISQAQQSKNKRNTLLTVDGVTKTKKEWAEEQGIRLSTLSSRINNLGWTSHKAVYTPVRGK